MDCLHDLESRRLDAGHRRNLADDVAYDVSLAHCADETVASLPVVMLGLLAGATADIFDRRRLLLFWQAWMLAAVGLLSVLTFLNIISPWVLLTLTFLLHVGTAMNSPAWQAIMPELGPAKSSRRPCR